MESLQPAPQAEKDKPKPKRINRRLEYKGLHVPEATKQAMVRLIGEGYGVKQTAEMLGHAFETTRNIIEERSAEVEDYAMRLPRRARRFLWLALGRLEQEVDKIPLHSLGVTMKMIYDIEALESGKATSRTETYHRHEIFSDFNDFVKKLESAPDNVIEAEIIPEERKPIEALPSPQASPVSISPNETSSPHAPVSPHAPKPSQRPRYKERKRKLFDSSRLLTIAEKMVSRRDKKAKQSPKRKGDNIRQGEIIENQPVSPSESALPAFKPPSLGECLKIAH
jgi:hypothetical protein